MQGLAEAQREGQTEGREQEKERLKLNKMRTIKLYREGGIEEAEFQGEMAAVELALRKLDVPEVGGVTYGEARGLLLVERRQEQNRRVSVSLSPTLTLFLAPHSKLYLRLQERVPASTSVRLAASPPPKTMAAYIES